MSKKQKRLVFYCSPAVVLLVLFVLGRAKLNEIEAGAQQLAQMGQAAQKVLGEYRAGLEKFDAEKVLSCYDDAYANEREGFWAEQLQSERDGVRVYEWKLRDARPFGKREVGEQVAHYLKGLGRVEESKFKLDSVEQIESPQSYVIRSFLWIRGTRAAGGGARMVKASAGTAAPQPAAEEVFES
jgi:hypothetical protein